MIAGLSENIIAHVGLYTRGPTHVWNMRYAWAAWGPGVFSAGQSSYPGVQAMYCMRTRVPLRTAIRRWHPSQLEPMFNAPPASTGR